MPSSPLLVAHADCPEVLPYVVAGRRSTEPGTDRELVGNLFGLPFVQALDAR